MNHNPASGPASFPDESGDELARLRAENAMLRGQLGQSVRLKQETLQLSYRLEQVLMRFGAMQTFIQKSVATDTMEEFVPIVCESIIDLLECGVAIYWSVSEEIPLEQRFYQSGLGDVTNKDLKELNRWVRHWRDSGSPGCYPVADTASLPAAFGLVDRFLLEWIRDSSGQPLAVILSGNTVHQNEFQLEGNDSAATVFQTFAKQVGAMIVSIKRNQIINLQIETIRTSEERLTTALASSNVGLWDWDLSCDRVHYSDQWKFQLGLAADDVGDSLDEWITRLHPDDREHALKVTTLCSVTPNGSFDLTLRMRARNRRWVWINTRGHNLSKSGGTNVRMIGTHIDVTAFKAMERRLIRAERKQRLAKEQAERENLAKSSFLAAVSHEIRTPLNGILGIFQMLRMRGGMERDQMVKLMEMGESSGMWMLKIIGESLDIARIEAGKIELNPEIVDLHLLLDDLRALKWKRAADLELEFRFRIAPGVPRWVRVDGVRLRQILVNLLNNAFKFTREGFVSLEVRAGDLRKDGHRNMYFHVVDSGIGISRSFGRMMFQPFTQAMNKSQSSEHGIGLGLMITKELVGLMGGKIGFSSRRGQGSRFKVALPLEDLPQHGSSADFCDQPKIRKFEGVVLVVDDDDISAEIAKLILGELGLQVDLAKNGLLGLELATAKRYDMILMDCWMPVMSGIEATVKLRASTTALSRPAPVLALTANARKSDAAACREAGMNDFITKPLLIESLIEMLTRYLPVAPPNVTAEPGVEANGAILALSDSSFC